jgi:hypothetical protein
MYTIYETFPRYCSVTDALVGTSYSPVATVATREEARNWMAKVEVDPDGEVGFDLRDANGRSVSWFDAPAPVLLPVDDDNIPF